MNNLHQKIQTASNIAIILVALLLGGFVVTRYLQPAPAPAAASTNKGIPAGTRLSVDDVDWSLSDKTLIMALSTTCRYCTESVPFYQKLAQQKGNRSDVRLIAVTPQSIEEARRYLTENGVTVDEISQSDLDSINVRGTPTLIEVDRNGAVVNSWVGKLPPEKEEEVVRNLFGEPANP